MNMLSELLAEQSLLLLFFVATIGYLVGKIQFKGIQLGVAAILFVGIAVSALDPRYTLPAAYGSLGLVIFVYSIGIASGPSFFASLKNGGKRNNGIVVAAILAGLAMVVATFFILQPNPAIAAGLFTGALTNTPALAGLVQMLSDGSFGPTDTTIAALPAVGYSIAYPMGVLGPILAIAFWQRRFKINYKKDAELVTDSVAVDKHLHNRTIRIINRDYVGQTLKELLAEQHWPVVFGRARRGNEEWLVAADNRPLKEGDLLNVIGTPEDVLEVAKSLGEVCDEHLELDLSQYDRHRIIVSSKHIAGRKIRELRLPQRFGAMITRVKRGDVDMLAHKNLILEYGDRVCVLAPLSSVHDIRKYLGDSYRDTSRINVLGIGIGISLGLLLGSIPIDLPGGIVFHLGDAGGPLIIGLILGYVRRSGRIVWGIPYTANLTLREFGLILMLASIGTRSGQTFIEAMNGPGGLWLFIAGAVISLIIPFVLLPVLYKKFKLPFAISAGMMAAAHTQPAVQAYAVQQANNDLPNHGYAIVFPTAIILKIILAQVLLIGFYSVV